MNSLEVVLSRLEGVKKRTNGFTALCPAHEDQNPSLSIAQGEDGCVLLKCFAGCATEAICAAIGITMADLFAEPKRSRGERSYSSVEEVIEAVLGRVRKEKRSPWRLAAGYPYRDASEREVMRILRFEAPDASDKTFRAVRPDGGRWRDGAPKGQVPLYRLGDLAGASQVFVCEGEKATDCAVTLGLDATTSAFGASSVKRSDWSVLAGREVVLLPDHDAPGEKWTEGVVQRLLGLIPPPTVRVVRLPDLPASGDIVEFAAARRLAGLNSEEIAGEIAALVEAAPPFGSNGGTPPGGSRKNGGATDAGASPSGASGSGPWGDPGEVPQPEELPDDLPPVMPFEIGLLPRAFQPWIGDIADRLQCPPDYPAVAGMVGLATVVGRRVAIRPKVRDDWTVVPNLWGAIVGRPSLLKTPALQQPLKPLQRLEIEEKEAFEEGQKAFEAADMVAKLARKAKEGSIKAAIKSGGDALKIAQELIDAEPEEITRRRFIVNDTTVEKLGEILNENPNGVLLFRDELAGFLKSLEKDGHESARAFYLEAWNGNGRFTYDRIMRGTVDIEAAIISILGAIQPGPLAEQLRRAVQKAGDDGFIARFQLAVWPDTPRVWKNVDRWPDTVARRAAYSVFERLVRLDAKAIGAETEGDDDDIPFLRFAPEAQRIFDFWREGLEVRLRSEDEHPAVESHLAKYRSLIPSIALLIHLADGCAGAVGTVPLEQAIAWGVYLESHARRLYSTVSNADMHAAKALSRKILKGDLEDGFTLRDVHRRGWTGLDRESAQKAITLLIDLDWLRSTIEATGGRAKTRHWINPRIPRPPRRCTDESAESPSEPLGSCEKGADGTDESGGRPSIGRSVSEPPGACEESADDDELTAGQWGEI